MRNRRFARIATSDDEDEVAEPRARPPSSTSNKEEQPTRKMKRRKLDKKVEEEEESQSSDDKEEPPVEDAKPVGEVSKVTGKGRGKRNHYKAFEYDGNRFELEDPVLLTPEESDQKPYVAIIKDISQVRDGSMMVTGQWFYRPEEAEKKGGGSWQARDTRELFYSFHRDEVPAESVMHKCVVHFVPLNKQLPIRSQHPGFIVQKVYDTVERKLWKLTDKDYEDNKQHEIDILVQKTRERLGELPDIETVEASADQEDQLKNKRTLRRKNMEPLDVTRENDGTTRSDHNLKAETPGSTTSNASEFYAILVNLNALTGDIHRDKCLERLLQGIQYVCNSKDNMQADDEEKRISSGTKDDANGDNHLESPQVIQRKSPKVGKTIRWPDAAVAAVTGLEKASHDSLGFDLQKYNQKMRQLVFNLKNNALLARRLLNGELEPSVILNMSPNELKEGLTAEETAKKEPDESERMQMTDARCSICTEKKVGVTNIIQGGRGDRYELLCIACGNSWYAFRDEVSTLTIDEPSAGKSVGTAPWATAKFEDVEKSLVSPRESDKPDAGMFKKTTAPYMPVLENQKSFNKSKTEETPASTNNAE